MGGIGFYYPRRNSAGFDRLIDGGENNVAVARHMDDYAASGKVGDDFIFRRLILRGNGRIPAQKHQRENCAAQYPKEWRFAAEAHFKSMLRPVAIRRNPNYVAPLIAPKRASSFQLVGALSRIDVRKEEMVQRLWD